MILKASQRGGGKQLGLHLLNSHDNEHVTVHEVRGFGAPDVVGAMKEAYATSQGTKCRQFLFSVSLNPPQDKDVPVESFETAIDQIEERNNLTGQPRVIVFHEKEGRRHAHAVWSRIDAETMTARNLPFFKERLQEISKEIYREHDWKMPRGFINKDERDPRNFTLAEWQEAKRIERPARGLKEDIQNCWAISDNKASFQTALKEKGLYLARGDKRGFVAVNAMNGKTLSLSRFAGKKPKELTARLGAPDTLPSITKTNDQIAKDITPKLQSFIHETQQKKQQQLVPLDNKRIAMRDHQRQQRQKLEIALQARQKIETKTRAKRLRTGIFGLWDRVRGEYKKIEQRNLLEAQKADKRDSQLRHQLVSKQQQQRQALQTQIMQVRDQYRKTAVELHHDKQRYQAMRTPEPVRPTPRPQAPTKTKMPTLAQEFQGQAETQKKQKPMRENFNTQAKLPTPEERLARFKEKRIENTTRPRGKGFDRER